MKATIESTSKVIEIVIPNTVDTMQPTAAIPARIWEGVTEGGIKFHAYITRVAVAEGQPAAEAVLKFLRSLAIDVEERKELLFSWARMSA